MLRTELRAVLKATLPAPLWLAARNLYWAGKNLHTGLAYRRLWGNKKIVTFTRLGQTVSLVVVNPNDVIQGIQAGGAFYEEDDLEQITPYFKPGGVFVDIGANTGQHSIYFAKLLGASKAILFEPVPLTCKILIENIRLNNLSDICDLQHLGVGLSDHDGFASFAVGGDNLGATALHEGAGNIKITTGDAALSGERVDFIKIDVEGLEMKVLRGLRETIGMNRPVIYVEVDDTNRSEFEDFRTRARYNIAFAKRRYDWNENVLILPN